MAPHHQCRSVPGGLSGVIITNDLEAKPINRVKILLTGIDADLARIGQTDDKGRFAFSTLPAGRYVIHASKPPFLDTTYGAKHPYGIGTAVRLADGQHVSNLTIRMTHGSAITGNVTDADGQPIADASVVAIAVDTSRDRLQLALGPLRAMQTDGLLDGMTAETDEQGTYRLHGLPPGRYAVVVNAVPDSAFDLHVLSDAEIQAGLRAVGDAARPWLARPGSPPGQSTAPIVGLGLTTPFPAQPPQRVEAPPPPSTPIVMFAPVYYPGTVDPDHADFVTLGASDEQTRIDIQAAPVPVNTVDVSVSIPSGETILTRDVKVSISRPGDVYDRFAPSRRRIPTLSSGGVFTFDRVPAGHYLVRASSGLSLYGEADLFVTGWAGASALITLQHGLTAVGKVVVKDGTLPEGADIRIGMTPFGDPEDPVCPRWRAPGPTCASRFQDSCRAGT